MANPLMKSPDLIIIGAGAAGLMCAITAANRGRRVLVLERANKAGKKILMSGGGRCNFTNLHVTAERFLSSNPNFCKSALSRYTQWDFIAMVEKHGIEYFEKETINGLSGQLFCRQSSKLIVSMLLEECRRADVQIKLDCEIDSVKKSAGIFKLKTKQGKFRAGALVVAAKPHATSLAASVAGLMPKSRKANPTMATIVPIKNTRRFMVR